MRRGFFAAALVTGALVIGGTAAALEVPEVYTVTIEFFPEDGGPTVKAIFKCHRAEACHERFKAPIDGKERTFLFSGRVRGTELLELELMPWGNDARSAETVLVQNPYERNMSADEKLVRVSREPTGKKIGALPELKRVEHPKGRIRFTVSAG
jgi:hypothetical protein